MVYVDNMAANFRGMVMCHMLADTSAELLTMAETIGLDCTHIQAAGTHKEHFDVSRSMRAKAVRAGAKEITWKEAALLIGEKRQMLRATRPS